MTNLNKVYDTKPNLNLLKSQLISITSNVQISVNSQLIVFKILNLISVNSQLVDNVEHLCYCTACSNIMTPVINCLTTALPNVTPKMLVMLNFSPSDSMELPLVWFLATSLSLVWEARQSGKQLTLGSFSSEVFARVKVLQDTKWKYYTLHNCAVLLLEMFNANFT